MKSCLFLIFLALLFSMFAQYQWLYGMALFVIIVFPIFVVWLLEMGRKKVDRKESIIDFRKMFNICINISLVIFIVLMIGSAIAYQNSNDSIAPKQILYLYFYFTIITLEWLIVNYFATASSNLRKSIMSFVESINCFFKEKFLISILVIVFSIFLKSISSDLFIGLIGSYIFFFLTKIDGYYKDRKADGNQYNKYDIGMQVLINISLVFILSVFEQLFHVLVYEKEFDCGNWWNSFIYVALFVFLVVINYKMEWILNTKLVSIIKKIIN